jgi:hypothetical protein
VSGAIGFEEFGIALEGDTESLAQEAGNVVPRANPQAALAAIRELGKRETAKSLEVMV